MPRNVLRNVFPLENMAGCLDYTRKESKNDFFILETKWNYQIRTVAFYILYVSQFDFFFMQNYINDFLKDMFQYEYV